MFYLTRFPNAYNKLATEVRQKFSSEFDIRPGQLLQSCQYLQACIDESLRMSPSIGSCLFREVEKGGALIDGHVIPEGYDVGTGIYSLHHNETYFPQPYNFLPERWMGDSEFAREGRVEIAMSALHPFSYGPRACIGKNLAYIELMAAIALTIWKFDFRSPIDSSSTIGAGNPLWEPGRTNPNEFQLYDHVTCTKHGPMVQFRQRVFD